MTRTMRSHTPFHVPFKLIASLVFVFFTTTTVCPASLLAASQEVHHVANQPSIPVVTIAEVVEQLEKVKETVQPPEEFLNQTLTLTPVQKKESPNEVRGVDRYSFEDALDQLQPGIASAVILESINLENLEKLINLTFEVGLIVLKGEIVLFTTGSSTEVGILAAARKLANLASLIAHTHVSEVNQGGPSLFDIEHAVEAPGYEYVLTQLGSFAYNNQGKLNDGAPASLESFLTDLQSAVLNAVIQDQVAARSALNEFIAEMDRYNEAEDKDREIFRTGSTPLLDSITGNINDNTTHTNNPNVALKFAVGLPIPPGEQLEIAFSEDGTTFTAFENFANSIPFILTGADGNKSVFVKVKDTGGNDRTFEMNVILDRKSPDVGKIYEQDFNFILNPASDFSRNDFGNDIVQAGDLIVVADQFRSGFSKRPGAVELLDATGKTQLIIRNPDHNNYRAFGKSIAYLENGLLAVLASGVSRIFGTTHATVFIYDVDPDSAKYGELIDEIKSPAVSSLGFHPKISYSNGRLYASYIFQDHHGPTIEDVGIVRVYDVEKGSATFGQQVGTLNPDTPEKSLTFGSGYATREGSPPVVAVGSRKYVEVFNADPSSANFGDLIHKFTRPASVPSHKGFGESLVIKDDLLFVGVKDADSEGGISAAGLVLVYDNDSSSGTYGQVIKTLNAPEPLESGDFGKGLALIGDQLFVGESGSANGKVFVFDVDRGSPAFGEVLQVITGDSSFGEVLRSSGDYVYVGRPSEADRFRGSVERLHPVSAGEVNSILINGKPKSPIRFVNDLDINLILNFQDETTSQENLKMAVVNHGDDLDSQMKPYQESTTLKLKAGADGQRSFNVRIWDEAGNAKTWHTTVIVDREAPTAEAGKDAIAIAGGTAITNQRQPLIQLHAIDSAVDTDELEVAFSLDGTQFGSFQSFAAEMQLPNLSFSTNGNQTVYVKFRDKAGNESTVFSDTIVYDGTAPVVNSVTIQNGDAFTESLQTTLQLDASDAFGTVSEVNLRIRRKGDANAEWGGWQPYKTELNITLPSLIGDAEVVVQVRDEAGNTSIFASDTIEIRGQTTVGPLEFLQQGLFELTLDQEFDNFLASILTPQATAGFSADQLIGVEFDALHEYFRDKVADVFDFVVAFPTIHAMREHLKNFTNAGLIGFVLGLGASTKEGDIRGVGLEGTTPLVDRLDNTFDPLIEAALDPFLNGLRKASGLQQGAAMLDIESILNDNNQENYINRVLLEEMAHRWLVNLSTGKSATNNPLGILGRGNGHWSAFFDAGLSPFDGIDWRDNGNGTFTMESWFGLDIDILEDFARGRRTTLPVQNAIFNDFDLYAMGIIDKTQVSSSFVIDNPNLNGRALTQDNYIDVLFGSASFLLGNHTIRGTRRNITIQDIINIEGEREPTAANSQKDFTAAFVIAKDKTPNTGDVNEVTGQVERLSRIVSDLWDAATRGLSTMKLGPAAGVFDAFKTRVLDEFNKEAGDVGENPAEVKKGEDNLKALDDLDKLIKDAEDLLAPLIERAKTDGLVAFFLGDLPDQVNQIKKSAGDFRKTIQDAIDGAKDSDTFVNSRRDNITGLLAQSAVTGLLPLGFGATVSTAISDIQNLFVDLTQANTAFGNASGGMTDQLNAFLAKLKGPVTGHKFRTVGNAGLDVNDKVFGEGSAGLDGAGDSLILEEADDFNFGTGDFTIDFRLKMNSHSVEKYLFKMGGGNDLFLAWHSTGGGRLDLMVGGQFQVTRFASDKAWHHIAIVRENGIVKLFVDGVQVNRDLTARGNIKAGPIRLGAHNTGALAVDGKFEEFRMSKTARWSGNFTPETGEYSRDQHTNFLLHFTQQEFDQGAEVDGDPAPPPAKGTIEINSGSSHTTSTSVTLGLTASGQEPIQMQFSQDGGTTFTALEAFSATKALTLVGADGDKTIIVRYKDANDETVDANDTITLDRVAPTGSVRINNNAAKATSANVTLNLAVNDAVSADADIQMAVSLDGGTTFSAFEAFSSTKNVSLPGANGIKTVIVRYRDEAGHTVDVQDTIELDKPAIPFSGKKFVTRGNAGLNTNDKVFGEGSGGFDGSGDSIVVEKHDDFNYGNGDFTVDFRVKMDSHGDEKYLFKMGGGNDLFLAWHSTGGGRLDLMVGGQFQVTRFASDRAWHHVAIVRKDGVVKLFVDGVQVNKDLRAGGNIKGGPITIGAHNSGALTVDGKFEEFRISKTARWMNNFTPDTTEYGRDENTNFLLHFTQQEFTDGSEVDGDPAPPPAKGTIEINGGATHTTSTTVTLGLTASGTGPIQMQFSQDGGTTFTALEAFNATKQLTLTGADGSKQVIVRYKDANDETIDANDTITLDRAAPTGTVRINNNAAKATSANVTLNLTVNDAITSDANIQMAVSLDGGNTFGAFEAFSATKNVMLPGDNGIKTVVVRYRDEAGHTVDAQDTIELDKPAIPFSGKKFVTRGNTGLNTDDKVLGEGSGGFDGAGDAIVVEKHDDFNLGTGDFSVDFRVKLDSHGDEKYLFKFGGGNDLFLAWHSTGGGRLDLMVGGQFQVTRFASDRVWHHIAIVRENGIVKLFVDGVQVNRNLRAAGNVNGGPVTIGAHNSGALSVDGKFDEFRVSKVARWTSNFTPDTGEYGRDENTQFLLHFTQEEFTQGNEVGGDPAPPAAKGTIEINSGATHTTSTTVTLGLTASGTDPIQMQFSQDGGTTFTALEAFNATKQLTLTGADGNKEIIVRYKDANDETVDANDTITLDRVAPTGSVLINNDAATATSANVTLNLDVTDAITSDPNIQVAVSLDGGTTFSAFEAYTSTKNVTLPGENGIKTVIVRYRDEAGHTVDVQDTIELDKPAIPFTGKKFLALGNTGLDTGDKVLGEGSAGLDGNGDSIVVERHDDFNYGTGDFTVDFRLKMDSHSDEKYLFKVGGGNGLFLAWHSTGGGRLDLMVGGQFQITRFPMDVGNWNHFAIVRKDGVVKLFVNGVQVNKDLQANGRINGGAVRVGSHNTGVLAVDGKFDEFRMSDTARWSSNFTPDSGEYGRDANTNVLLHFTQQEFDQGAEVG